MEKLFEPHFGLMIWTVVTFALLLLVLGKFGWKPLIAALDEREARMKAEFEGAREAREGAEKIKAQLDAEMAAVAAKSRELLAQASRESDELRAKLKAEAESDSRKIRDKTLAELQEEKSRLVRELRQEVADLSVRAAERLMRRSVDEGVQKSVLETFFKDIEDRKAA